ncbi:hypothetical protein C7256_20365 [Enterocloster lavalensis]|nr:hypothetical protein C7256_20365 [Enterocloster lavalensis]
MYNVFNKTEKRGENVNEKEKKILETIAEALPKMTEFDKGYFLGKAESKAEERKCENKLTPDRPERRAG